jgi:plasmid stabilization system protein ParE
LERICERIERDNPEAARLTDSPHLGRASFRIPGRRELTFAPLPYIAVYQVKPNAIEISRIFHGAQDWP